MTCLCQRLSLPLTLAVGLLFGPELRPQAGTPRLVRDIIAGSFSSTPEYIVALGDRVLFQAIDLTSGRELWISDGTSGGTTVLMDIDPMGNGNPRYLTELHGKVYFAAGTTAERELWVTDGTAGGTVVFADLNPSGSSDPRHLARVGSKIYFSADAGQGREPWVTDGTPAGTFQLADIAPGSADSDPKFFAGYEGRVAFSANDQQSGNELWFTDGTTPGTGLLKDINPTGNSNPVNLTAMHGRVYFGAYEPGTGRELWRSDFTAAGTVLETDIVAGPSSSRAESLAKVGMGIFFSADTGTAGFELHSIGGVTGSQWQPTRLELDLNGTASSFPSSISPVGYRYVYFDATLPGVGQELVQWDPVSQQETIFDINPGPASSFPLNGGPPSSVDQLPYAVAGSKFFFAATHVSSGRELWVMDNGATSTVLDRDCSDSSLLVTDHQLGNPNTFNIVDLRPNRSALMFLGVETPSTPIAVPGIGGCKLRLWPNLLFGVAFGNLSPAGHWHYLEGPAWKSPSNPGWLGLTVAYQALSWAGSPSPQYEFSNPVRVTIGQ